jgi:hypothetical protein
MTNFDETTITATIDGHDPVTMSLGAFEAAADRITLRPPHGDRFGGADFLDAEELERVGQRLIERHGDRFGHLDDFRLQWLWKAKGGKSSGSLVLGRCVKASGGDRAGRRLV